MSVFGLVGQSGWLAAEVDLEPLERLRRLPEKFRPALIDAVTQAAAVAGRHIHAEFVKTFRRQTGRGEAAWANPRITIAKRSRQDLVAPIRARVWSRHPGAAMLHFGDTARVKTPKGVPGRLMPIPFPGSIVAARRGRGLRQGGAWDVEGLRLRRSKAGTLLMVLTARQPKGEPRPAARRTGRIPPVAPGDRPMYVLKAEVTVPGRPYVTRGMDRAEPEMRPIIAAALLRVAQAEGLT